MIFIANSRTNLAHAQTVDTRPFSFPPRKGRVFVWRVTPYQFAAHGEVRIPISGGGGGEEKGCPRPGLFIHRYHLHPSCGLVAEKRLHLLQPAACHARGDCFWQPKVFPRTTLYPGPLFTPDQIFRYSSLTARRPLTHRIVARAEALERARGTRWSREKLAT